jgi:hypothetical protein
MCLRMCCLMAELKDAGKIFFAFHSELKDAGKSCPLWSVPGVSSKIVMVEWQRCCDLGATADVLNDVLLELVNAMGNDESRKHLTSEA